MKISIALLLSTISNSPIYATLKGADTVLIDSIQAIEMRAPADLLPAKPKGAQWKRERAGRRS